jgi:hypothetical protein
MERERNNKRGGKKILMHIVVWREREGEEKTERWIGNELVLKILFKSYFSSFW